MSTVSGTGYSRHGIGLTLKQVISVHDVVVFSRVTCVTVFLASYHHVRAFGAFSIVPSDDDY